MLANMPRKRNAVTRDALRDALDTIEVVTNAKLNKASLRHMLTQAGLRLSAAEVDEVLRDPDILVGNDFSLNKAGTSPGMWTVEGRELRNR